MEDDKAEENQPSTSKKENRSNSVQELHNRRKHDEGEVHGSNSEYTNGSYSTKSHVDIAKARQDVKKHLSGKREAKTEKKKRGRPGRIEKRRKSKTRRQAMRRMLKRKSRRAREMSVSTIFSELSSQSSSKIQACRFCGHRCCRRRFEYKKNKIVRQYKRKYKTQRRFRKRPQKRIVGLNKGSKGIQAGSCSMMLSPLFVNTNSSPVGELLQGKSSYCEITPEMICQSLRRLTMWRQYVLTAAIADDLKKHYPVNRNAEELLTELNEKLRVAEIEGRVTKVADDKWCLNCALQSNSLERTHVTNFWNTYADTLTPIEKQGEKPTKAPDEDDIV